MRVRRALAVLTSLVLLAACASPPKNSGPANSPDAPAPVALPSVAHPGPAEVRRAPEPELPSDLRVPVEPPQVEPPIPLAPPRIALALGGGAAKGFVHVGVIKALEASGIFPDIVAGTSAGSVVGALYASGMSAAELQRIALSLEESAVSDWTLPNRGFIKGEGLQNFINNALQNRLIEKLPRVLGIVATDLLSGQSVTFRRGNTGMAVRASSAIPGVIQPVAISGREYVDGALTSPVPVRAAREMGADIVIAIDISSAPGSGRVQDSVDLLLQTFSIMGRVIAAQELLLADVVVHPDVSQLTLTTFESRRAAMSEGERAGLAAVTAIRAKIDAFYRLKKGDDKPF